MNYIEKWVQFHFVGILKSETMFSFQCFALEWILGCFASSSKNTTQSVDNTWGCIKNHFLVSFLRMQESPKFLIIRRFRDKPGMTFYKKIKLMIQLREKLPTFGNCSLRSYLLQDARLVFLSTKLRYFFIKIKY